MLAVRVMATPELLMSPSFASSRKIGFFNNVVIALGLGTPPNRDCLVGNAAFAQMDLSCGEVVLRIPDWNLV